MKARPVSREGHPDHSGPAEVPGGAGKDTEKTMSTEPPIGTQTPRFRKKSRKLTGAPAAVEWSVESAGSQ